MHRERLLAPPSFEDVRDARSRIYPVMKRSPLLKHPRLDELTGLNLWIKHENHNPTGSFKIRGGLNLLAKLSAGDRARGVISASTGNHGQSIAFASRLNGVRCRIVVPQGNNPDKNAAMRALGADVVEHGRDFDDARALVEEMAAAEGWRYVHSANEPDLIAGVGTYALEIFEELPAVDVILVAIGGGSGASGCAVVRTGLRSAARVVGVQAAGADAFARSWRTSTRVTSDHTNTFAEGMATRVTFDLTFGLLATELADVVTLREDELEAGVRLALDGTHNLAEGAGAASIAAAVRLRPSLAGQRVVCVMSGGNIDRRTLARVIAAPTPNI